MSVAGQALPSPVQVQPCREHALPTPDAPARHLRQLITHRLHCLVLLNDEVVVLEAVLPVAADVGVLVGDLLEKGVEGSV